jgi:hypothetical protein
VLAAQETPLQLLHHKEMLGVRQAVQALAKVEAVAAAHLMQALKIVRVKAVLVAMVQRGLMVLPTRAVAVAAMEILARAVVVQVALAVVVQAMVMVPQHQQLLVQPTEAVGVVVQAQVVTVRLAAQVLLFFVTLIHLLLPHLLRVPQQLQQRVDIVITHLPLLVQLPSKEKECLIFQVFGHQDNSCKQLAPLGLGLRPPARLRLALLHQGTRPLLWLLLRQQMRGIQQQLLDIR